ncbi:DUF4384 domain-containing protein [Candidatus Bathyarchaeota archaeon]|nr:DUF4384 domain-containing protein [Candidatus Bathyarchaeota archaeon]
MFGNRTNSIIQRRIFRRKILRLLKAVLMYALIIMFIGGVYYVLHKRQTFAKHDVGIEGAPSGRAPVSSQVTEVVAAINEGNYDLAKAKIEEELKRDPGNSEMKRWQSLLMRNLEIDFKFNYLPGRKQQITTRGTSPGAALTQKDPYYLNVHSFDQCFLYLFQLQSSGELAKLFPNSKYVPTSNPVPGGPIRIPDGYDWFYLDDTPGTETIYLVASRWRQKTLEMLCAKLESEDKVEEKRKIIKEILFRLEREERSTESIPGLTFGKYQFKHDKAVQ